VNLDFSIMVQEVEEGYDHRFDKVIKKGEWVQWRVHNKDNHDKYESNIFIVASSKFDKGNMRLIFENIADSMDVCLFGEKVGEIL